MWQSRREALKTKNCVFGFEQKKKREISLYPRRRSIRLHFIDRTQTKQQSIGSGSAGRRQTQTQSALKRCFVINANIEKEKSFQRTISEMNVNEMRPHNAPRRRYGGKYSEGEKRTHDAPKHNKKKKWEKETNKKLTEMNRLE